MFEQREEKLPDKIGTPGVASLRTFSEGTVASCMPENKLDSELINIYTKFCTMAKKRKRKKKFQLETYSLKIVNNKHKV